MNEVSYRFEINDVVLVEGLWGTWEGYVINRLPIKTAAGEWVPVYMISSSSYGDDEGAPYGEGELREIGGK